MSPGAEDEPLLPVWFCCWALIVAGVLLVPDSALEIVAEWLLGDGYRALGNGLPADVQESMRRQVVTSLRMTALAFAVLYLVVRFLLRRSIREAERVERGLPL